MSDHFRLSGTRPYAANSEEIDLTRHTMGDVGAALADIYDAYEDEESVRSLGVEDLVMLTDYAAFREACNEINASAAFMLNDNVKYPLDRILDAMADTEVARNHFDNPHYSLRAIAKTLLWVSPDEEA